MVRSWKVIDVVVRTPDFYVTFSFCTEMVSVGAPSGTARGTNEIIGFG